MIYRLIAPEWLIKDKPTAKRALEGTFTKEELKNFNDLGYNVYFFPNYPSIYDSSTMINGSHIDTFQWVFVDCDLKDGYWPDKETFIASLLEFELKPTRVIDSGNGIHAYWMVSDLDPMSFLKLQRRLVRRFNTDEAVGKICQLMRAPNSLNTKQKDSFKRCHVLYLISASYTCEQLDNCLAPITSEDEQYCQAHYNKTLSLNSPNLTALDAKLPAKFGELLRDNKEVKELWIGNTDDRSKADYRIAHIMFAHGFSREEAMSTLVNAAKALERAPVHRVSYAENIVNKIWTMEETKDNSVLDLSSTVGEIVRGAKGELKGTRFACYRYIDDTEMGFRLGDVIGLAAGSGVGKTAIALNMFMGFVKNNPEYHHFFVPLEQPVNQIAQRWVNLCGDRTDLHDRVHVISNYDDKGQFRHLSFEEIKDYLLKFKKVTGNKVGCVVIDHIGALKKKGKDGENQDLMEICHRMKAFALETNTLLVMQSQAPREKAGIGDLELNKDAAYGTVYFESYCDYLITVWQPLKRCYKEGAPTVTSFKFCKIRHKSQKRDVIQEDIRYNLFFDSETGILRQMTQAEETSFEFFNTQATNKRKQDRKTDVLQYETRRVVNEGKPNSNQDLAGANPANKLPS